MASRKSQRLRANPVSQSEPESDTQADLQTEKPIRRRASVYDAVAGRVTSHLIKTNTHRSPVPDTPSFATRDPTQYPALAPEEVLFRRKNAPPRYAEKDIYFAGTDSLSPTQKLPESDLLKAVHGYAAGYYEALAAEQERKGKTPRVGGRVVDERSMDETALLAFGILLEEASREALGKNGDLVFTEGIERDVVNGDEGKARSRAKVKGKEKVGGESGFESEGRSGRPAKKRKMSRGASAG